MKITEKLKEIKNTVVSEVAEYKETVNLTAEEYANRYGYQKIMKAVIKRAFLNQSETNSENQENEEIKNNQVNVMFAIKKTSDNSIIIIGDSEFGEKEEFKIDVLKKLFEKMDLRMTFDSENNDLTQKEETEKNENVTEYMILSSIPETKSLEDQIKDVYDHKEEYFSKAACVVGKGVDKAKDTTKVTLRKLADWADKNL